MGHNPSEPRHLCRCANLTDMEMNADTAVERNGESRMGLLPFFKALFSLMIKVTNSNKVYM